MNASRSPAAAASQLDFAMKFGIQKPQSKMARQKTTQTQVEAEKRQKERQAREAGRLHYTRKHPHQLQVPRSVRGPGIKLNIWQNLTFAKRDWPAHSKCEFCKVNVCICIILLGSELTNY